MASQRNVRDSQSTATAMPIVTEIAARISAIRKPLLLVAIDA
jgi:hypothetical protein